jgi:hypothetical protein
VDAEWHTRIQERRITSQGGQDGVLASLFQLVGTTNRYFVEFGFDSKTYTNGGGANTFQLYTQGWRGLLLDGNNENADINLHAHRIYSTNIVELFQQYNVPAEPDYVSIDIDSADLWVFAALTAPASPFRPRVVSVEHNCNFGPDLALSFSESTQVPAANARDVQWQGDCLFGASMRALYLQGRKNGYVLVYAMAILDLFFVRADVLRQLRLAEPPYEYFVAQSVQRGDCALHPLPENAKNVVHLVDVEAFLQTGNYTHAVQSARAAVRQSSLRCLQQFSVALCTVFVFDGVTDVATCLLAKHRLRVKRGACYKTKNQVV